MSYFSNATTKDAYGGAYDTSDKPQTATEANRFKQIMNAPIENLVSTKI